MIRQGRSLSLLCFVGTALLASWTSRYPLMVEASTTQQSYPPEDYVTLEGMVQYPDGSPFNETSVRVALNQDAYNTYSAATTGRFTIPNVPPGIHTIDVHSTTHHFSQIKIQVLAASKDLAVQTELGGNPLKCLEYYYPGADKKSVPCGLTVTAEGEKEYQYIRLTALATFDYFEKRAGFSIFSILRNPMLLMMLVSVGLMFLMPKMMDQLEPEEKARMKQQMAMQSDPTKMLGQLWGDLTSGEASSSTSPKRSNKK